MIPISDFKSVSRINWVIHDMESGLYLSTYGTIDNGLNHGNWINAYSEAVVEISEWWVQGNFELVTNNFSNENIAKAFRKIDAMDANSPLTCVLTHVYRIKGLGSDQNFLDTSFTCPDFRYRMPYRELVLQYENEAFYV